MNEPAPLPTVGFIGMGIMGGGASETLARVEPLPCCLGANITLQGGAGAGQHTKLCNQSYEQLADAGHARKGTQALFKLYEG